MTDSFGVRYYSRNFDYWTKRGVDGPKPAFCLGNIWMVCRKPFPLVDLELSAKYGKIYGIFCGNLPILTVNDPELIQSILVKDFHVFKNRRSFKTSHNILNKAVLYARDDKWKRIRSLSTRVFTGVKLRRMTPLILQCVTDLTQNLNKYSINGKDLNLKEMCGNYTMDVIARCAFDLNIDAYEDPENPFVKSANSIFHPKLSKIITVFVLPKFLLKLLKIGSMFDENSNQFIFNLSRKLLKERRNTTQVFNDLLQLMIDTSKDEKNTSNSRKGLTDNEIIAQSWLFLLAGYETTSTGITFCLYELALNPDIQERLYEELQTALDSNNNFDYEELLKLPFLDAVISEALRLYPPFLRIEREANTDYQLGETGLTIESGLLVHISIYGVHHNEEFFPEPEKFDPDRFMPENKDKIIPYSYLPFAVGPRNCVAMRFALMEIKFCIANVINAFRLSANSRTDIPPKFLSTTHLCTTEPLIVSITNRSLVSSII